NRRLLNAIDYKPITTSFLVVLQTRFFQIVTVFPDDDSECEPPDPIPNSEVKPLSADGSVGPPHVRVGHRQVLIEKAHPMDGPFFMPIFYSGTVFFKKTAFTCTCLAGAPCAV